MVSKILQVFYGNDALPYKDKARTVHFPIAGSGFQGASNTTHIRFYFGRLGNDSVQWVALSKLPNGKLGSIALRTYFDNDLQEPYALLEMSSFYTQYKGDVFISLQGYQGGILFDYDENDDHYSVKGTPTVIATGSIKITINYAPQFIGSGEEENVDFQRILALLGTKLNVTNGIYVLNAMPTQEQLGLFEEGQIVYVKTNNNFYKVEDGQLVDYIIFNPENIYLTTEETEYVIPPQDR